MTYDESESLLDLAESPPTDPGPVCDNCGDPAERDRHNVDSRIYCAACLADAAEVAS